MISVGRAVVLWGQSMLAVGLGAILHELAHASTAVLLRADLQSVGIAHVEYEIAESAWLRDRVISLAPQLSGVAVGIGWIVLAGWPTPGTIPGLAGWLVYVGNGGAADFRRATADSAWWHDRDRLWQWRPWSEIRPADQAAWLLLSLSTACATGIAATTARTQAALLGLWLAGLTVGGSAVIGQSVASWEQSIAPSRRALPDGGETGSDQADD